MQHWVRTLVDERGLTVVLVTHDLAEAVRLADGIWLMADDCGRLGLSRRLACPIPARDAAFIASEIAAIQSDGAAARTTPGDRHASSNEPNKNHEQTN